VWFQRLNVLFFIEIASRRVHFAGCTAHPDEEWVTRQARQVAWTLAERSEPVRVLICDHDQKFTRSFDDVFQGAGIRMVRTPIQARQANGIAERFVRTARSECLDWLLILNTGHLERTLTVFIDHYNAWRPHRSLDLAPPNGRTSAATGTGTQPITLKRRDRLGGLLHEYERAA
jgi:transposase InsO family protein